MFCPSCKTVELKEKSLTKVTLDACPECHGVWFDNQELERVLDNPAGELIIPPESECGQRICPHCVIIMRRVTYPGSYCTVDICETCRGIWLDDQELKEINVIRNHSAGEGQEQDREANADHIPGIKGKLIRFINQTIDDLVKYT